MAGTKGIIEIIVVIAAIYGAWTYREQIMAFLKSHGLDLKSGTAAGAGDGGDDGSGDGNGGGISEEDLIKLGKSDRDANLREVLGIGMAIEKYKAEKKSSLARSGWIGRSYYGRISV